jgi:endo-1,4-beta-xylanase
MPMTRATHPCRLIKTTALFFFILVLSLPLAAQVKPVPEGGVSLIAGNGIAAFKPGGSATGSAAAELVAVTGQPFDRALRIRTKAKPDNHWDLQATARTRAPVKKGDALLAVVCARALDTSDESGQATLDFIFEKAGDPYTKSVTYQMKLNREWSRFYIPFQALEEYGAGAAQCNLVYGYLPQSLEVGGVDVLDFGRTVALEDLPKTVIAIHYQGREADAPWRKAAAERIEKYRKGDLTVVVRDAKGRPLSDASVSVRMKKHAYGFGAAVTAQMLTVDSDDGRKYRAIVEENFNKVVFENDLKFGPWEAGKTSKATAFYNMSNTMKALQWLKDRSILVRGHTYLWAPLDKNFYPKDRGFDIGAGNWDKMRQLLNAHIDEKGNATKDFIYEWDVINHPVATWGDQGRTWETVLGREFYIDTLRRARTVNPGQLLYVNEGSDFPGDNDAVRAAYESLIRELLASGAPLDGIGFMSHFDSASLAGMDFVYSFLERYAPFGLKLQSTELDVGTDGDEQAQADYYRDFMTMFFSHPATVGIVMWGFWESRHWNPDRALYRANWELKPCGRAWLDLVKKQWWTNADGRTDKTGAYKVRGFLGDYEVTVTKAGRKKTAALTLLPAGTVQAVDVE